MQRLFVTGGGRLLSVPHLCGLALEQYPTCEIVNFDALTYAGNLDKPRRSRWTAGIVSLRAISLTLRQFWMRWRAGN